MEGRREFIHITGRGGEQEKRTNENQTSRNAEKTRQQDPSEAQQYRKRQNLRNHKSHTLYHEGGSRFLQILCYRKYKSEIVV